MIANFRHLNSWGIEILSKETLSDIDSILSDMNIPWDELQGRAMLITGATGIVGNALVGAMSAANSEKRLNMRILTHNRDISKGKSLSEKYGVESVIGDIREAASIAAIIDPLDYIFHCAAVTDSAAMVSKPVDVITTAVDGTKNMLELAKKHKCKSFVYISSMEIYGQLKSRNVSESDLGYLNLASPRSCYPESKRLCEALCAAYFAQFGVNAKTARLAQTFGCGTPRSDKRVFAQFARSAIEGKNIELHTEGKSRGNYCYISDTVRGLLTILLKGENGEAYNIANPAASMTIREMAELVANEVCNGEIKVVVSVPENIEKRGYAPEVDYILNVDKLKALGWAPKYGLDEMYRRLIFDWNGINHGEVE